MQEATLKFLESAIQFHQDKLKQLQKAHPWAEIVQFCEKWIFPLAFFDSLLYFQYKHLFKHHLQLPKTLQHIHIGNDKSIIPLVLKDLHIQYDPHASFVLITSVPDSFTSFTSFTEVDRHIQTVLASCPVSLANRSNVQFVFLCNPFLQAKRFLFYLRSIFLSLEIFTSPFVHPCKSEAFIICHDLIQNPVLDPQASFSKEFEHEWTELLIQEYTRRLKSQEELLLLIHLLSSNIPKKHLLSITKRIDESIQKDAHVQELHRRTRLSLL